jgi:hypothetical protein
VESGRDIVEIGYMLITMLCKISNVFVMVLSPNSSEVDVLCVVLSHNSSKVGMLLVVLSHDSSQINKMLLTSLEHDLASALFSRCNSILQRIELRLSCTSKIIEPEKAGQRLDRPGGRKIRGEIFHNKALQGKLNRSEFSGQIGSRANGDALIKMKWSNV